MMNPLWTTLVFVALIPIGGNIIRCNALDQLYVSAADQGISKYDSTGKLLYRYHENKYGGNVQLDAGNPLQLLVSYPDYSVMVLLDNTLSEITTFQPARSAITHFSATCLSLKNGDIWIFDDHDFKIKRMNRQQQVIWQSDDMISLTGKTVVPVYMVERGDKLYLDDPDNGIFVFDLYGHWVQTIHILHQDYFEVENGMVLTAGQKRVQLNSPRSSYNIPLPDSLKYAGYCFCGNKFLTIGDQNIHVFTFR